MASSFPNVYIALNSRVCIQEKGIYDICDFDSGLF